MVVHLKKKNIIYRDDYFNKYYKDGKMDKNARLVINIDGFLVKVKDLPDLALNNKNEVLKYCYGVKVMIPEYVPYITFVWEKKNV